MKTYRGEGRTVYVTAPSGGVTSGQGLLTGTLFGFCGADADEGDQVALWIRGEFDSVKKKASQAWTVGQLIYWDDAAKELTTASTSGHTKVGYATAVAASGASLTTGRVVLTPSP